MLVPIILALIGFIGTFIGNAAIAGAYNLFYGYKYYDIGKMFSFMILANGFLLLMITPIYFTFGVQGDAAFLILGFHVFFSIFMTNTLIEIVTNPNYAGSAMMGTFFGFSICAIIYMLVVRGTFTNPNKVFYLMMVPSTIGYSLIPFFHAIWEKFYYRFYEVGNNFLYIPSISEVAVKEEDMMTNTEDAADDNITVDLG